MADIRQAAKWMQEGKKVKRTDWHRGQRIGTAPNEGGRVWLYAAKGEPKQEFIFWVTDALADWEVAE